MIFFLSHPIQYVSPILKELSKQTKLKVYYYGGQSAVYDDKSLAIKLLGYGFREVKSLRYGEVIL